MVDDRCQSLQSRPHAAGAKGGNQGVGRTKGGNSKIHLAVDAHGMRVRVAVTAVTTADCTQTAVLIGGIAAQCLQTDCGYDSNGL